MTREKTVGLRVCVPAAAILVSMLADGCAAPMTQPVDNSTLVQPADPTPAADGARDAVNDINAHTDEIEDSQPGGTQEP